jgi:hypothetical protein
MIYKHIITAEELVNYNVEDKILPIGANFSKELFAPHIDTAMVSYIIPLLTEDLYYDFLANKNVITDANCISVSDFGKDCYNTLWERYLKQLCAWVVFRKSISFIAFQVSSGGIFRHKAHGDTNQYDNLSDIDHLKNQADQNITAYVKHIREFICKNIECFDKYPVENCRINGCYCPKLNKQEEPNSRIESNHGFILY